MPQPTPFHGRTSQQCNSLRWKEWAGYYAVCSYDNYHEREYFALRHAAGLIDVTPLYKYDITGPDAGSYLSRLMVRDVQHMRTGRVQYCCWCDDAGKVIDDGTVTRFDEHVFRVTSALPMYSWFHRHSRGFVVEIQETTHDIAVLSLQGPNSRAVLEQVCDANLQNLSFFASTHAQLDKHKVVISRTGYTGDLGYEIWMENHCAIEIWDILVHAGKPHGLLPAGLDAMDITRVEAGFILNGVDYFSAPHCLIDAQKSTPFEIGLGWMVKLDRESFLGQKALQQEKNNGSTWVLRGLVLDWDEFENLHREYGLPPHVPSKAWRTAVPVYNSTFNHVGQATSGTWSPTLKQNLALATLRQEHGTPGQTLQMEVTVEYQRRTVSATVVETPFYNPERKKA